MSTVNGDASGRGPLRFGIGQSVRRVEDRRFVTGRGRYVDDLPMMFGAHAVVLRSPFAHAAAEGLTPVAKRRASADYKRLAQVLTRRAIESTTAGASLPR